jgi:hypothetical protein
MVAMVAVSLVSVAVIVISSPGVSLEAGEVVKVNDLLTVDQDASAALGVVLIGILVAVLIHTIAFHAQCVFGIGVYDREGIRYHHRTATLTLIGYRSEGDKRICQGAYPEKQDEGGPGKNKSKP